jgi:hypothetical protein
MSKGKKIKTKVFGKPMSIIRRVGSEGDNLIICFCGGGRHATLVDSGRQYERCHYTPEPIGKPSYIQAKILDKEELRKDIESKCVMLDLTTIKKNTLFYISMADKVPIPRMIDIDYKHESHVMHFLSDGKFQILGRKGNHLILMPFDWTFKIAKALDKNL